MDSTPDNDPRHTNEPHSGMVVMDGKRQGGPLGRAWRFLNPDSAGLKAFMFAAIFGLLGSGALLVKDYALTSSVPICGQTTKLATINGLDNACKLLNGLIRVKLANGSTIQTHGFDTLVTSKTTAAPSAVDASGKAVTAAPDNNPVTPTTTPVSSASTTPAASTDPGTVSTPPLAPSCATDYYNQLIYGLPAGASAISSSPANIVTTAEQANGFLHDSAVKYGVDVRYKMLCSSGRPSVTTVHFKSSDPDYSTVVSELQAQGFNNPHVKYWIYLQGRGGSDYAKLCKSNPTCFFGLGTLAADDRLSADNASNGVIPEYAILFNTPWNWVPGFISHESGHTMGAVQNSAPGSDHGGHCNFTRSTMCSGSSPTPHCSPVVYDCLGEDYFNPSPLSGNYLNTHWNIGSSLDNFVTIAVPATSTKIPKVTAGDINGDGYADIIGIKTDGTMRYYANNHGTTPSQMFNASVQIGIGWQNFNHVMLADVDGDKKADILGTKTDGTLWYYHSAATDATHLFSPGIQIGIGWNIFTKVMAGDVDGDGHADLIGIKPDGTMWYYKYSFTDATHLYLPGVNIGAGWNIYRQVDLADINGDGHADVIGLPSDGTLWYYPYAPTDAVHPFSPRIQIGSSGWQAFNKVIPGDTTNDKAAEMLAIKPDGTMMYYANAIKTNTGGLPYTSGVLQGAGWQMYLP